MREEVWGREVVVLRDWVVVWKEVVVWEDVVVREKVEVQARSLSRHHCLRLGWECGRGGGRTLVSAGDGGGW